MWITHPEGKAAGLFLFKKTFSLAEVPAEAPVRLFADTKYRLLVNGELLLIGPCKRGRLKAYYDTVDLAPYLKTGENVIEVYVLHFLSNEETKFDHIYYTTFYRTAYALLMFDCPVLNLVSDGSWLVSRCPEITLEWPEVIVCGEYETVDFAAASREFVPARVLANHVLQSITGETMFLDLAERPIPYLTYVEHPLTVVKAEGNETIYTTGAMTTAAVRLRVSGTGKLTLTYSEAFFFRNENGQQVKKIRDDSTGEILGTFDTLLLDGHPHEYETFYLRPFRYLKVTSEGGAKLENITCFEIKYPLQNDASFTSDDPDAQALWDVSVRTLNNCMHDSFEDCPYYEQLQYVMDSRLEALFLRPLTNDDALIRKCLRDFNDSRMPDGMICARYPSAREQRIPGFGLHYVFFLHDQMRYRGDRELIKEFLPTVDGILAWFLRHVQNNLLTHVDGWNYLDWVKEWDWGVPDNTEGLAVYQFMLICALRDAAELAEFAGRPGLSEEYRQHAEVLKAASKQYYDKTAGYFGDTISKKSFSQHGQIWAVLADVIEGKEARDLLIRAAEDKALPVCSYSMLFYVFRAYEKAGLYDIAYRLLDKWRLMLRKHCTTWVENDTGERSECHAWGSLPLYEFTHCILGVRPAANGFDAILVKPYVFANTRASGTVMTPHGNVDVAWRRENGRLTLTVAAKVPVSVFITLPDGSIHQLDGEKQTFMAKV